MLNLFYRNRQLLWLSLILIVVWGLLSCGSLPRLEDPEITPRYSTIETFLPGASAQRVEALITQILEEELQDINEIKTIESSSSSGVSIINLELQDTIDDVNPVWAEVQRKIEAAAPQLPADATKPRFLERIIKGAAFIVGITWDLPTDPNFSILGRISKDLESQLLYLSGTEDVKRFGTPEEEILITIDPGALTKLNLTVADLSRQIQSSDAKVSAGTFKSDRNELLLKVDTQFDSLERIQRTPIQTGAEGQVTTVADIAQVSKQIQTPPDGISVVRGQPGVVLAATVEPGVQVDQWARSARATLETFQQKLPNGLRLVLIQDQSQYVKQRLGGVVTNLFISSGLVFAISFWLLGWRAAVIVGITLPLVTLMALILMKAMAIPLHQISVTGLIISMGLMIDNAIIVVDEVTQQLRQGQSPASAVHRTVRNLAVPLSASTLTTVFTFIPIATSPGATGEFIGTIGTTVILALVSSLIVSLAIVSALTAIITPINPSLDLTSDQRLFHPRTALATETRWLSGFPRTLKHGISSPRLTGLFYNILGFLLHRPIWGIILSLILPIVGFSQFASLEQQFFPPTNRNQLEIELELPRSSAIVQTRDLTQQASQIIVDYPQIEAVDWFIGESAPIFYYNVIGFRQNVPYYAQGIITLRQVSDLQNTVRSLQHDLETAIPEAEILVKQLGQGPAVRAPIAIELTGPNLDGLRQSGNQLRRILASTPQVVSTQVDLADVTPSITLKIDEAQAQQVGLSNEAIARQLEATLEGNFGGSLLEVTEDIPVRVRGSASRQMNWSTIDSLQLVGDTANGKTTVPLSAIAKVSLEPEVSSIKRRNGERINTIRAYLEAGALPDAVLKTFQTWLKSQEFQLPSGYRISYGGEADARSNAIVNLLSAVTVLVILMASTLILSFNSFVLAGLIGVIAILSIGLGIFALWIFQSIFGFTAILGMMGLVGLSVNDSIVVLAALREDPQARHGHSNAVATVVIRSTRHVLATTLTTVIGLTPLIFDETGFWPPLAIAIIGGLGGATILALVFVPCIYQVYARTFRMKVKHSYRNQAQWNN